MTYEHFLSSDWSAVFPGAPVVTVCCESSDQEDEDMKPSLVERQTPSIPPGSALFFGRMRVMLLLLSCHVASPVIHSLKHVYTASSEVANFPDFVAVVFVDGVQTDYYDSITKTTVPIQAWMDRVTADDPEYWKRQTSYWEGQEQIGRVNIEILKTRFNQTEGIHVIQVLHGCEWDDETGQVNGFGLNSYQGEDILILDMKAQRWIATKPQLIRTQHKWNNDKSWLEFMEHRLTQECPVRLQNSLNYGKSTLLRTELPSVSLLRKTPSSPVSCHATGFYPDRAVIFWSRHGEELHQHVDHGELLHNPDGTFQMSVELDVSLVTPEDWWMYECVFQLSGVENDIITKLDPANKIKNSLE
ncbi:major histocompatibility complex class I-related gene protein-like [Micropterus salmoides]|uniref:major histocompatibility complex class I-related gene protein-like n=1 Tax=Micropterus salmoides TaxID=27706 RepID=UPI0018EC102A|nr:major histocompatibility complex class I-related gene protein-like [Micropterus salmoides]